MEQENQPANQRAEPERFKRLIFAALSSLVPGSGQIYAGYRIRGAIMLGVTAMLGISAWLVYQLGSTTLLSYSVQPRVLVAVFILNLVILAFRLGSVVDAYRKPKTTQEKRAGGWRGWLVGVSLALVLTFTAAPHAVFGYYTYLTHDLLTDVFQSGSIAGETVEPTPTPAPTETPVPSPTPTEPAPTPTPAPGITPEPTPEPSPTPDPTPTPAPEPTPSPEPTPEPEFADKPWVERGRLTILLVGSDAGPYRTGARADVIMVASLDLNTGQPTIFSIPRNYGDVPLSEPFAREMGTTHFPEMISSLYSSAQDYPHLAPEGHDPGLVALKGAAEELLGIPVDYYSMVDMAGFVDMVNAFGGVIVNVSDRIHVRLSPPEEGGEWRVYDIQPGEQTLDGHEALAYVRSRTGTSDYDRMQRQRCLVASMAGQVDVQTLVQIFPDVIDTIRASVTTDIPLEILPDLVMLRDTVRMDRVLSIGFVPPEFSAGQSSRGYNQPPYDRIRETVQNAIEHPESFLDQGGDTTSVGAPC